MTIKNAHTISVLKRTFREYYFKKEKEIEQPENIEQREFGYAHFGQIGMIRHLSFKSMKELDAMLVKEMPSDVYCSNAYYRFPTQPMQEKDWLAADLIFDIDGKDLDMPCVPSHSYPKCTNCAYVSEPDPDIQNKNDYVCPSCNGIKVESILIPCNKCIEGSKKEVKNLKKFLTCDFGLAENDIHVYFSGNNGFHIRISDDAFVRLDPQARSDMVSYLTGTGLMAESIGVRKSKEESQVFIKFPSAGISYGWRGRLAHKLKIETTSLIKFKHIVEQKGGYANFKTELDRIAKEMGIRVDPQVTTDVHRIFRMPGTLNSKSGLAKIKCDNLESFDPFREACVLGNTKVNVKMKTQVKLKLNGESFHISKESAELPAYTAVYLICKGLAEVY